MVERLAVCVRDALPLRVGLVAETAIRAGRGMAVLLDVVATLLLAECSAAPIEGRIAAELAMWYGRCVSRTGSRESVSVFFDSELGLNCRLPGRNNW